jgi:hypothetical protein
MKRLAFRDDSGASMVIVLVLVTGLALGLAAVLSLAGTSIGSTVALRGQTANAYDADGAMQTAIDAIRASDYNNSAGQQCFGGSDTLMVPNASGSGSSVVTCTPDPSKVLIHCPSLTNCNRPGSAILTTGRIAGEDAVHIEQPTGSDFRVHGIVFSNSNINVVNGALRTNNRVYARGPCTGTVISTPAPLCGYGNTANPLGEDPGYQPATTSVPPRRSLPACTTPNSVVTFEPGYYDDAAGLSAMMSGNSACRHSTWWFKPGVYYFDFHNTGANANPLLDSKGGNLWTVNDGYLVAGTPVDRSGVVIAKPPVPATIPGSCNNPINDANAVGVQFIFGGDSRIAIKAGQAEFCGTYSTSKPPVAIYGLKSGTDTPVTTTLSPNGATSGQFTNPTNVTTADGQLSTWDKKGTTQQTGTLTATGYVPSTAIPAGSVLTSAKVRVVYGNTKAASATRTLVVTANGGTASIVTLPAPTAGALRTETVNLPLGTTAGSLARLVYDGAFTGAQAQYSAAKLSVESVEQIDSVVLELTYVPPSFRAGTGCVTTGPYTGLGNASRCALVTSENTSGNQFYVQGTTYAPNAVLDLTLNNAAEQVFRFGVIVRAVWVKLTGSFSYDGPVIEVPDDSPGFAFSVYLTVHPCVSPSSCAPVLRSRVAYVDADPVRPVAGERRVVVLSWSGDR